MRAMTLATTSCIGVERLASLTKFTKCVLDKGVRFDYKQLRRFTHRGMLSRTSPGQLPVLVFDFDDDVVVLVDFPHAKAPCVDSGVARASGAY